MDADKVATLKRKLLEATDFHEIVEYFFTEFGSDVDFAKSGEPVTDTVFAAALAKVATNTMGTGGVFAGNAFRVAEHRLVHGAFTLGEWTVMMFYFEDVEQGFMAIGDDGGASRFARFSLVATPDGIGPTVH